MNRSDTRERIVPIASSLAAIVAAFLVGGIFLELRGKDALNAGKYVREWPHGFEGSELADPIGEELRFRIVDDSIGEDAGANAGKLIDSFRDVVLKVGAE